MSQSNSLLVKLLNHSFSGAAAGAVVGFLYGIQESSRLQTALIAALIGIGPR